MAFPGPPEEIYVHIVQKPYCTVYNALYVFFIENIYPQSRYIFVDEIPIFYLKARRNTLKYSVRVRKLHGMANTTKF
jgi:hypothetical protein